MKNVLLLCYLPALISGYSTATGLGPITVGENQAEKGLNSALTAEMANPLHDFFRGLYGTWKASPADSSFISELIYRSSDNGYMVLVSNTLSSASGEAFMKYDGVYIYDPLEEKISFTTLTENQVHRGTNYVRGDTLFHEARLTGQGEVRSYSSAIVKTDENTLRYYADYSSSETPPKLTLGTPLIYRRQEQ